MKAAPNDNKGFTSIELLIVMAISSILLAGIYSAFQVQLRLYSSQQKIAAIQQNVLFAIEYMVNEITMAGHDPTRNASAGIQVTSNNSTIEFTMDITGGENDGMDNDGDGVVDEADEDRFCDGDTNDANEHIRYVLTNDENGDGVADGVLCHLGREEGGDGVLETIAENIEALNFVYFGDNDTILDMPITNPENIRTVQILIIARADSATRKYTNYTIYRNQMGEVILDPHGDNIHRRALTGEVKCRNLGL